MHRRCNVHANICTLKASQNNSSNKERDEETDEQRTNAKIRAMWEFSGGGVANTALTPRKSLLSCSET